MLDVDTIKDQVEFQLTRAIRKGFYRHNTLTLVNRSEFPVSVQLNVNGRVGVYVASPSANQPYICYIEDGNVDTVYLTPNEDVGYIPMSYPIVVDGYTVWKDQVL